MCNCAIPCGFDHCCMSERYRAYEAMPQGNRPRFWTSTPCPKPHPAPVLQRARDGDCAAAAVALEGLVVAGVSSWGGFTRDELRELAAGDTAAVEKRRRRKADVRAQYARHPERYRRWSVSIDVELSPVSTLSSHEEFASLQEAIAWAEKHKDNRRNLARYLKRVGSDRPGGGYTTGPSTHVRILSVMRQRLTYPWYWINGDQVWWPEEEEWRWESESYKALVAEMDARDSADASAAR